MMQPSSVAVSLSVSGGKLEEKKLHFTALAQKISEPNKTEQGSKCVSSLNSRTFRLQLGVTGQTYYFRVQQVHACHHLQPSARLEDIVFRVISPAVSLACATGLLDIRPSLLS